METAHSSVRLEYRSPTAIKQLNWLYFFGACELVAGLLITGIVVWLALEFLGRPGVSSRVPTGLCLLIWPAVIRLIVGAMLLSYRGFALRTLGIAESIALAGCASYFITAIVVIFGRMFDMLVLIIMPALNVLGMIGVGFSAVVLGYLHRPEVVEAFGTDE